MKREIYLSVGLIACSFNQLNSQELNQEIVQEIVQEKVIVFEAININRSCIPLKTIHCYTRCCYGVDVVVVENKIEAETPKTNFNLFPNPAASRVSVNVDELENPTELWVIDMLGRIVYTKQISKIERNQVIDVTDFKNGSYRVFVSDGEKVLNKQLVVQN